MNLDEGIRRLAVRHFAVAIAAFGLASALAVMQALARAEVPLPLASNELYYLSVTAHGVLMALVFTTFFIVGLGYVLTAATLGRLEWQKLANFSFWLATVGTTITTLSILSGQSTVLYTFYPPLQAHWTFYFGATLLVVGSWGGTAVILRTYIVWRREHRDAPVPLAVHGLIATNIIWLLATAGLAVEVLAMLLPWSLGWVKGVDPILARTLFWWFGHPLTYFWLVPAYVVWYTIAPQIAGGRLFSDRLARVVFVMFILFSTPVGFHHQFSDPGIEPFWKMVHTITTLMILFPSLVTAFTVIASFETAGRMKGARGLFDWLGKLPWRDPLFASIALAMLTFALGGFGGAINAAFAMNAMVHNTAWIQGHFHLTVGTAVALTFLGVTYWLMPRLLGKELAFPRLAQIQPYLWFVGMMIFSIPSHIAGIYGMPRRVFQAGYFGAPQAQPWQIFAELSAFGGILLFVSSAFFLIVVIATAALGRPLETVPAIELARPLDSPRYSIFDRFLPWVVVAIVLIIAAYALPIHHLLSMERFPSPGFKPF